MSHFLLSRFNDLCLPTFKLYSIFNHGIHYQIDYLEIEIHRLRDENAKLKEKLEQSGVADDGCYV